MITKKEAMAMTDEQRRDALIAKLRNTPKGDRKTAGAIMWALAQVQDRIAKKGQNNA